MGPIVELIDLNEFIDEAFIRAFVTSAIDDPLAFDYAPEFDEPLSLPVVGRGDQKPVDEV